MVDLIHLIIPGSLPVQVEVISPDAYSQVQIA